MSPCHTGMGQKTAGWLWGVGHVVGKDLRPRDLHEPVAAALLRGRNHGAPQPIQRLIDGLGDRSAGHQRHEPKHAQLDRLFHEPLLPVTLGQGDAQCQTKRQLAIDLLPGRHDQLDLGPPDPLHPSGEFDAAAVEHDRPAARPGTHHVNQVVSLRTTEHHPISGDRGFGEIAVGHGDHGA